MSGSVTETATEEATFDAEAAAAAIETMLGGGEFSGGKPDGGTTPNQEQVENPGAGDQPQPGSEAQPGEGQPGAQEEPASEFDAQTGRAKRVRVGGWSEVDQLAVTIRAAAPKDKPITLAKALELAQAQLGVPGEESGQHQEQQEVQIPEEITTLETTLAKRREELTGITGELDALADEEPLYSRDLRDKQKHEKELEREIERLERQIVDEKANFETTTTKARDFENRWFASMDAAAKDFPQLADEDSPLYNAMYVELDKIANDEGHELFGNPETPKIVCERLAAKLKLEKATAKPGQQAKPAQPVHQPSGAPFRPAPGGNTQTDDAPTFDPEALVKTAIEDPDAAAAQMEVLILKKSGKTDSRSAEAKQLAEMGIRFL